MTHELCRLTSSLHKDPLLITESALVEMTKVIEAKGDSIFDLELPNDKPKLVVENGIAIISLEGPVYSKPNIYSMLFGGVDYQTLLVLAKEAATSKEVKTILLNVDGPGGQAHNMIYTASEIRKLADANGKRVIAYIDGTSASATYGLTVAAHEVIASEDSMVGSVGVVIGLENYYKEAIKEGLATWVFAGKDKIPFDLSTGDFSERYTETLQGQVDELYDRFTGHISSMTGMSQDAVKSTEAGMFTASQAQALGMINKVMNPSDFYEYLAEGVESNIESKIIDQNVSTVKAEAKAAVAAMNVKPAVTEAAIQTTTQESTPMSPEEQATFKAMQAELQAFRAEKAAAKTAELKSSFEGVSFLAGQVDAVAGFMLSDLSEDHKALLGSVIDAAKKECSDILASAEEKITTATAELATKVEEAEAKVTEAEAAVVAAQAEATAAKEEFGTPSAITNAEVKNKHDIKSGNPVADREAQLQAAVDAALAAKNS